jgi:hypothetical protein
VSWPTVELYFKARCDTARAFNFSRQNFRLYDNGEQLNDFMVWCPEIVSWQKISVAMVLDAGGSMTAGGNAAAKLFGGAFIDMMDGVLDEATVLWFNSTVAVWQQMTTIKPLLYGAVDGLPASGGTAIWDAASAGIYELINNGVNPGRGVILVTDGAEGSSTRSLSEVISLANRNQIRVYTIGVGTNVVETELRTLAEQTGGRYYRNPNAGQIASIYQDLSYLIPDPGDLEKLECLITFEPRCGDGTTHLLELQLPGFCGGDVTDTISYVAPLDTTTFTTLLMDVQQAEGFSGADIPVQVNLMTPVYQAILPPMSIVLRFDEQCMQFKSAETPNGTLLGGKTLDVTAVPGGVRIETPASIPIMGYGPLFTVTFKAPTVSTLIACPIDVEHEGFERGCFTPIMTGGGVTVHPETAEPILHCALSAQKIVLDSLRGGYSPMPFYVDLMVKNLGSIETDSIWATIAFTDDLQLAGADAPDRYSKPLRPKTLKGLEDGRLYWEFTHPQTLEEKKYTISVSVHTANADSTSCSVEIVIPADRITPFPFSLTADGSLDLCVGDSVKLDAGETYASYAWSTGADTRSIVVRNSGKYFCAVTDSRGFPGMSDTLTVVAHPVPYPRITPGGSVPICSNTSITLTAEQGFVRYDWNTGETGSRIVVNQAGFYTCTVTDAYGCTGSSDPFEVTVIPAPAKPVITRTMDDLESSGAHAYQWWRYGNRLTGDTMRTLRVTEVGNYTIEVFAENGCSEKSDPFVVTVLDAPPPPSPAQFTMQAWPDPVRDLLHVTLRGLPGERLRVLLSDVLGRSEVLYDGVLSDGSLQLTRNASTRPTGPLFLLLLTNDGIITRKILKQ